MPITDLQPAQAPRRLSSDSVHLLVAVALSAALVAQVATTRLLVERVTEFVAGPVFFVTALAFVIVGVWALARLRHVRREGWSVVWPAAVCIVTAAALVWLPIQKLHPFDDEMARAFREHRSEFSELVRMLDEDGLRSVSRAGARGEGDTTARIPPQRAAEYARLFDAVGVEGGIGTRYEGGYKVYASTFGLAVSGSSKGYVYATQAPTPLTTGETEDYEAPEAAFIVYRHLEGGWYLYYDVEP